MTVAQRMSLRIAPQALVVAALSAYGWHIEPQRGLVWLAGVGTVALIWIVTLLVSGTLKTPSQQRYMVLSVTLGCLMVVVSYGITLAHALGYGNFETYVRVLGAASGIVLMVLGNRLPKVLGPVAENRCAPAVLQRAQRFAGWGFVLAGLFYSAAWIFLPVVQAGRVAVISCLSMVVITIVHAIWTLASPPRNSSST